jgi:anti-sigma B factor antagonist
VSDLGLAPGELEIERSSDGETLVLMLRGELDLASVTLLEGELGDPHCDGFGHIVIDLGGVGFMDSSGLHCLLRAEAAVNANGRRFSLRPGGEQVQRLFELTRLVEHFKFEE